MTKRTGPWPLNGPSRTRQKTTQNISGFFARKIRTDQASGRSGSVKRKALAMGSLIISLLGTVALIFWAWNSLPILRGIVIASVVLNELAALFFGRFCKEIKDRTGKAMAIYKAIQNTRTGQNIVIHNDDGSVWCIIRVETKEHEHDRKR